VRHIWKSSSAAYLETAPYLEKRCGTPRKVRYTGENISAPHLEKRTTLRKMRQTWRSAPHLVKCITLGKMRHT